ncbi:MAG: ribosome small subunit-dependent GTPase A [Clostridiales bacterium]|nr:ribosome small subunit-dependent GTPase A [Clostridiales bacterium]
MTALCNDEEISCIPSGNAKRSKILVGDYVDLIPNDYGEKQVVSKVLPRRNVLIRPPIANLDQLFIIFSKVPKTDYLLVDKLLVYCYINNIVPFIVINKVDLYTEDEILDIKKQYSDAVSDIICVSGTNGIGIDELRKKLNGMLSAFAGQSAVGKSTILNAISPKLKLKTNGLSRKINRGKHTTRHSEIYVVDDIKIADTPGFSMLDLNIDIEPEDLGKYYKEFDKIGKCKYTNCDHTNIDDKDCMIAKLVKENKINDLRYKRYVQLYNLLKEKWRKKYD